MGKAMSNDTNSIIVRALAQGHSRNDIAKMCGVSTRAVTRVSTNLKKHGSARPPPSGLKQGRPAKLTRKQADALLAWITARNYTFYVKDLVKFLREHHAYKGCDGTVRRGMIRAGFKRKEPYHKSEITIWIPPDHAPQFDVILDEEQERRQIKAKEKLEAQGQPADQPMPESHPSTPLTTSQQNAPSGTITSGPPDGHAVLSAYPAYYHQHHASFQAQQPIPPLDPNLYQMDAQQHQPPPPPTQTPQQQPPPLTKSPAGKKKRPRKEEELQNQVTTMQSELAKQSELIRQLQLQLAQSQAHEPGTAVQQAPMIAPELQRTTSRQPQDPGQSVDEDG